MTALTGRWAGARRILAVRLDALGDVLMTTPALRAVAAARPAVELTLLTSPAGAAVAPLLPEVSSTIVARPSWLKPGEDDPDDGGAGDRELIDELRAGRHDGAVIFTVNTQSALPAALACRLAGIPLRLAHARENPYRLLTDWVRDPEPLAPVRHEVRRQLDLVAAIGARTGDEHLSLRVPPGAARSVRARLLQAGIAGTTPWAVIHPGASASSRRWPVERFAAVARALAVEHGWRIVSAGSGEDGPLADAVVAGLGDRGVSLRDSLDLGELAALIAAAPVLIANNSGPAHVAAAVGTPVVDVYALTNLQHAPWGVPSRVLAHDVPCKGCLRSVCPAGHHACVRGVDPRDVVEAALALAAGDRRIVAPPAGILSAGAAAPPVEVLTR
jgi:lipopolysaccharide heptosyltransferase II